MKSLSLAVAVTLIAGCSTTATGPATAPGKDDGYYVTGSLTKRKPARNAQAGTEQRAVDSQQNTGGGAQAPSGQS